MADTNAINKSWIIVLVLSFYCGFLGFDRLYLGYKNWWVKLITFGGFGIWTFVDLIKIIQNKLPDANGVLPQNKSIL